MEWGGRVKQRPSPFGPLHLPGLPGPGSGTFLEAGGGGDSTAITSSDWGAFRRRGPPSYLAYSAFCNSASFLTASINFFWCPECSKDRVLPGDVGDEVDVLVAVVHQHLVVLGQADHGQPHGQAQPPACPPGVHPGHRSASFSAWPKACSCSVCVHWSTCGQALASLVPVLLAAPIVRMPSPRAPLSTSAPAAISTRRVQLLSMPQGVP
ncbi:hypothetical protein MC885_021537 [Smutsia gigantea]|nr:hypothetical protein MC885_021537 [Smutsia gigantea]